MSAAGNQSSDENAVHQSEDEYDATATATLHSIAFKMRYISYQG
jgi:hypothetical protein